MKRFLSGGSNKGEHGKDPDPTMDDTEGKDGSFPMPNGCLMIFEGLVAYDSKCRQKLARRKVYTAESALPTFLLWSESTITFDRTDHLESVLQPGRYRLVVDPIVGTKWLTKVLMDGGSVLTIMYAETLDAMGIDRERIRLTGAPFHGIMPGSRPCHLGRSIYPSPLGI